MIVRLFVPGLEAAQELHYLVFGPVTVVAIDCGGNERTVSPICGLYESNVRIGENFLARLRKNTDEGIVSGVQDESRHGDSVYHVSRGGASIVIDRTSKSAVIGSDLVVEIAQASQTAKAPDIEMCWKQLGLSSHSAAQFPQEVIFVETIAPIVQRVGAGGEVHGGANRCHRAQLWRSFLAPFAGELKHQVAAHGKSCQCEMSNSILLKQICGDGSDIAGKTGVIQNRR